MITVGLDFGTHQTKVCIENKAGVELSYTFMKFEDNHHCMHYTLPSIVGVGKNGLLSYGYLPDSFDGEVVRYFKQSSFRPAMTGLSQDKAMLYSVWYIAYILFDLEDVYGKEFTIQMGAPTDSSHVNIVKSIATRIVVSAYKLVEDVFENDKDKFLATKVNALEELTTLVDFSQKIKDLYGLLVFPEAYACLKTLVSQGKISAGMNLMIDIGGGTTDISFFTIENKKPQVYDFYSINKGLNYLTCADNLDSNRVDVTVAHESEIDSQRKSLYFEHVNRVCDNLQNRLLKEYKTQTKLLDWRFWEALSNRPLIYCGGGSTLECLREGYYGFQEKRCVSHKDWNQKCVVDIDRIIERKLCPILSTAYGLSISTENDNIVCKPFRDIFEKIRGYEELSHKEIHKAKKMGSSFGKVYGGFSYMDDWDAWK